MNYIFITGANGFLGSYLYNNFRVITPASTVHHLTRGYSYKNQMLAVINSSCDFNAVIIHAASATPVNTMQTMVFQSNMHLTKEIADCIDCFGPTLRVINISSVSVYGNPVGEIRESYVAEYLTQYGASKLSAEYYLNSKFTAYSNNLIHLRAPGIVGLGSYRRSRNFISAVARSMRHNEPISYKLDRHPFNNIVTDFQIFEICNYLVFSKAWKLTSRGASVNIASRSPKSLDKVLQRLKCALHSNSSMTSINEPDSAFYLNIDYALEIGLPLMDTFMSIDSFAKILLDSKEHLEFPS